MKYGNTKTKKNMIKGHATGCHSKLNAFNILYSMAFSDDKEYESITKLGKTVDQKASIKLKFECSKPKCDLQKLRNFFILTLKIENFIKNHALVSFCIILKFFCINKSEFPVILKPTGIS